ncbi:hypothetical protein TNCV_840551 [Trichonephila clavipes]|nr:hypothetical protein TNCV_840551 [Trichonephila clavipes]
MLRYAAELGVGRIVLGGEGVGRIGEHSGSLLRISALAFAGGPNMLRYAAELGVGRIVLGKENIVDLSWEFLL